MRQRSFFLRLLLFLLLCALLPAADGWLPIGKHIAPSDGSWMEYLSRSENQTGVVFVFAWCWTLGAVFLPRGERPGLKALFRITASLMMGVMAADPDSVLPPTADWARAALRVSCFLWFAWLAWRYAWGQPPGAVEAPMQRPTPSPARALRS